MDLFDNPFYILGATPRDDRRRILELADEGALLLDAKQCDDARSVLTMPRKRLEAELAWLPGLAPKKAAEILEIIERNPGNLFSVENVMPSARCNAVASALDRSHFSEPPVMTDWLLELCWAFEDIDADHLRNVINEERVVSGFPEITDLSVVESGIADRKNHYRQVMRNALDKMNSENLVIAITDAIEKATELGEAPGPKLLAELVDTYEVEAQDFLAREEENIKFLLTRLEEALELELTDKDLEPIIERLCQVTRNWDFVAQPIQVSLKSRGLPHEASQRTAYSVRNMAITLFNDYGKLELAKKITEMLQEVFAEVIDVAERAAEDAGALDDIAEQRQRLIEDAARQKEEWQREITYEADVGTLFKNKLRISPEGIEWKGQRIPLDNVSGVRWGGVSRSVNGIPSGTTYTIMVFGRSQSMEIELKNQSIYSNFVDRLWRSVGVRLLTEFLDNLKTGQKFRLGPITVSDFGIELSRRGLLSKGGSQFCKWRELVTWNGNGAFCIGHKDDKKLAASLSYLEVSNVHILEAAMGILWKQGGDRLSSILNS
ncbi:hypothetical protein [Marinobacter segnicrescens]|uniref:hypothetical protein n=1 Tax=Marinobacter segnicrescens TaxID=430453 RepID=UPI003A932672